MNATGAADGLRGVKHSGRVRLLRYRRRQRLVGAALCAYAVAAVAVKAGFPRDRELFPIFAWSLFSTVPAEQTDYGVRLLSIGSLSFEPPRFLEDTSPTLLGEHSPAEMFWIVQKLGDALESTHEREADSLRRLFESEVRRDSQPFRYEVVRRHYRTLDRWRSGSYLFVTPIASFVAAGGRS